VHVHPKRPPATPSWDRDLFRGPRRTGKTTLLRSAYPDAWWVDLLKAEEFRRFLQNPELLRQELADEDLTGRQVVIDEVQKVPLLLDEVHWLIENRGIHFALCGSSARLQDAYVADYLKEEVAAEGLVRNLPIFSEFLNVASFSEAEIVNYANIARECAVSSPTVKNYFSVISETMLARWLPAYRRRPKRRVIGAPKFYFADVGVANRLARRGELSRGSELYGKAFENWVFHELTAYNAYAEADEKRGRDLRKQDEERGKQARAMAERCRKGRPLSTDVCVSNPN